MNAGLPESSLEVSAVDRLSMPRLVAAALSTFLLLGLTPARADEDGAPSFRTTGKRETKEFVSRVGTAIVKSARSAAQKIEMDKYEYTSPRAGRTELNLTMQYFGVVTKLKYTADITVVIDSSDKDRWEVLNIRYKDSNKSLVGYSEKKLQALIKTLNR